MKSHLREKALQRTNRDSNIFGDSFSNKCNVRAPIHLDQKDYPSILKGDFLSRADPSILKIIVPSFF